MRPISAVRGGRRTEISKSNPHSGERGVDSRAADLDGDDGVQDADGGLEGLEVDVLVREDAEAAGADPEADPSVDVLLRGLEPCISLSLNTMWAVSSNGDERQWKRGAGRPTCLKMWWSRAS